MVVDAQREAPRGRKNLKPFHLTQKENA
jgi:hypothetical protein